jgi:hypothetical protein
MTERPRTALNVPGPFYVAKDECITCGAPEVEAPSLNRLEDGCHSCYFFRQPENAEDTYRALRAMAVSCVGAVRYGGTDPDILRRAAALGCAAQCDHAPPESKGLSRTHVTFHLDAPDAESVAESLAAAIAATSAYIKVVLGGTRLRYEYGAKAIFDVTVRRSDDGASRWLAILGDAIGGHIGCTVDDGLRSMPGVSDLRWYTAEEFRGRRRRWAPYPI